MKKLVLVVLLLGVCLFVGCGGSSSGGNTPPPTVTLQSIQVTPASPSMAAGATQQFTATGNYSDGSTKNLTSSSNWSSSTPTVATVSIAGLATGVTAGTSTISASSAGIIGSTTLTVTNPLVSIAVTPTSAALTVNQQQAFTAMGTFADGSKQDITQTATWHSSNASVAAVSPVGLAVAQAVGTASITAASGGITSNAATITVTNPLVSIAVTPPTASVAPNGTQQFTATGTFADGTTQNITTATTTTWTAGAGATITVHGGLAKGITPNTTPTITATSGAISGTAVLTVTNPLVSITITPPTASVAPNGTQQYTATGKYTDNSTQNITNSVTWSASAGGTITQGGLATGVTPNSTVTIMAAQGNISSTATLTVTNPLVSIAVTAPILSIAPTTTVQFTATGTYADHSTQNLTTSVTWASSNQNVATISNSQGTQGLALGLTPGPTSITATSGSITSPSVTLTVTSAHLVSIAVTPINPVLVYQTPPLQFTATGTFMNGTVTTMQDITGTVTWSSSDTTKITITVSGAATGVGTTTSPVTITATDPTTTISGNTTATVVPPSVVSIAITPTTTNLAQGTSRQYTATATLTNGSTLNVTNLATWNSSVPSLATVNSGLVKAATTVTTPGSVDISATYNSVTQTITLSVTNAIPQTITVTPIAPTIPAGVGQRFTATATFSDSTTQDISQSATWSSTNTGVATINNFGISFGIAPGTSNIQATFGGVSGSALLTVDTGTLTSITITPSQTVLAPASTLAYTAVGHYSDGTTQFISNSASWTSTNPSVVSITTNGGVATGQSAGTANITATYQSITSNTAGVVVTSSPLASIAVTPTVAKVPVGVSIPFAATGTFQNGTTQNLTNNATWASSQPAVATINNSTGQPGFATGVSPGQTSITAVFASVVSSPATLTVSNATVRSIAVTPTNPIVTHGAQVAFKAVATFSDGSTIDLSTQVTWTSSNVAVATINNIGQANTASPGPTIITATFDGVSGMTGLTVN